MTRTLGVAVLWGRAASVHMPVFLQIQTKTNTNLDKYKYIQSPDNRSPFRRPASASIFTSEFLQIHDYNISRYTEVIGLDDK